MLVRSPTLIMKMFDLTEALINQRTRAYMPQGSVAIIECIRSMGNDPGDSRGG